MNDVSKESLEPEERPPRTKVLHQRVAVTDPHLGAKIVDAFTLARSAGQDLNVTFMPPATEAA